MTKPKLSLLIVAALGLAALMLVPTGTRIVSSPDSIRRIQVGVQAAEDEIPRTGGTVEDVDRFAANLKEVDTTGAPEDLRVALSNYIAAVERHGDTWRQRRIGKMIFLLRTDIT